VNNILLLEPFLNEVFNSADNELVLLGYITPLLKKLTLVELVADGEMVVASL
jgi:hypothetical protein